MSDLERKKAVMAEKVRIWTEAIRAGRDAQRPYRMAARETMNYFKNQHTDLFERIRETYLDLAEKGTPICVNYAAVSRAVIGPHLYQRNPKREVNVRRRDSVSIAQARVTESVLNYSAAQGKLAAEVRKCIDDSLIRGRGYMRTGWDEDRGINTSWAVSSLRVVIDPGVLQIADAEWIAISTRMPLWRVKRLYGSKEKWRTEGLKAGISATERDHDEEQDDRDKQIDKSASDQVEVWEVYSKRGHGMHRGPYAKEGSEFYSDDDSADFVKLVLVLDHPTLLYEGDWEVPLYLDREWPIVWLDLVETLDQLYPESIMGQAMVHQKAMDVLSTLAFEAAKIHARDIYFYRADALDDVKIARLLHGAPGEAIPLENLPAGVTPEQVIFRPNLGSQVAEIARERDWHRSMLELVTGVLPVLHGAPDAGAQDRSATATQAKGRAANMRTGDMLARVEDMCSDMGRNEAVALWLGGTLTPDEIAEIVGDDIELGWKVCTTPKIKLRGKGLSIESLAPEAATYFETPDQANAVLPRVWQAIERAMAPTNPTPPSPELTSLYATLMLSPPNAQGLPSGLYVEQVRVQDVVRDVGAKSPRELVRNFSYTVVAGTTQRQDPQAKREHADMLMNQALPRALQAGDYNVVNFIVQRAEEAYGVPPDERVPPFTPPAPPPPPGGPPGAPPAPGGM